MEQHPVPQQISAYHFRLVGDMTVKQFIELASGIVAAWIIYSLPIHAVLRWPLLIFSVFAGIAFAFLPLEERPLDRWLIAFVKAIYSPTQFIWRKTPLIPTYLEARKIIAKPEGEERLPGSDRYRLQKYLETLPTAGPQTSVDTKETLFIGNVMKLYQEVQPKQVVAGKIKPIIIEEVRLPKVTVRKLKTPPIDPRAILRGEVIMPKRPVQHRIYIPKLEPVQVEKPAVAEAAPPPPPPPAASPVPPSPYVGVKPTGGIHIPSMKEAKEAAPQPGIPMPVPPTDPNVVAGMVLDDKGAIVENAIITIKDQNGNIARAQKTNKIGQFFIATPLENGNYEVEVEKNGLAFDIMKITLVGKPVPPIEIRAR